MKTESFIITFSVPDGVTVSVERAPNPAAAVLPQAVAAAPLADALEQMAQDHWLPGACPKHGPDRWGPSKFGGSYCTASDDRGPKGYCILKSGMEYLGRVIP